MRNAWWKCGCLKLRMVAFRTTPAPLTTTFAGPSGQPYAVSRPARMAALMAGRTATDIERTRKDSGSSSRPAAEPNTAITRTTASRWYFVACHFLYRFDSMSFAPRFASDFRLLTKWCSDPSGQIQPQNARPTRMASSRKGSAQSRPR